jgi:hypothetical protein
LGGEDDVVFEEEILSDSDISDHFPEEEGEDEEQALRLARGGTLLGDSDSEGAVAGGCDSWQGTGGRNLYLKMAGGVGAVAAAWCCFVARVRKWWLLPIMFAEEDSGEQEEQEGAEGQDVGQGGSQQEQQGAAGAPTLTQPTAAGIAADMLPKAPAESGQQAQQQQQQPIGEAAEGILPAPPMTILPPTEAPGESAPAGVGNDSLELLTGQAGLGEFEGQLDELGVPIAHRTRQVGFRASGAACVPKLGSTGHRKAKGMVGSNINPN